MSECTQYSSFTLSKWHEKWLSGCSNRNHVFLCLHNKTSMFNYAWIFLELRRRFWGNMSRICRSLITSFKSVDSSSRKSKSFRLPVESIRKLQNFKYSKTCIKNPTKLWNFQLPVQESYSSYYKLTLWDPFSSVWRASWQNVEPRWPRSDVKKRRLWWTKLRQTARRGRNTSNRWWVDRIIIRYHSHLIIIRYHNH